MRSVRFEKALPDRSHWDIWLRDTHANVFSVNAEMEDFGVDFLFFFSTYILMVFVKLPGNFGEHYIPHSDESTLASDRSCRSCML